MVHAKDAPALESPFPKTHAELAHKAALAGVLLEQHVVGVEVAVDDVLGVKVRQAARHLDGALEDEVLDSETMARTSEGWTNGRVYTAF